MEASRAGGSIPFAIFTGPASPFTVQLKMEKVLGQISTRELTETRYPCGQCGAMLTYAVGSGDLQCRYCGYRNAIVSNQETVKESDFYKALGELQQAPPVEPEETVVKCVQCAAEFDLDSYTHAGECPFCGTAVITSTGHIKPIKAKALLPFSITDRQAREYFKKWLSKLWFAPGDLVDYASEDSKLKGVYIPYWTYDSSTVTSYAGQRGDTYYVQRRYTSFENGRQVQRTRMEPRIRWTSVSGRTQRYFDDVLVGATTTLPRTITDWLEPWDLENLVPYSEAYISGFSSEVYQVGLDEGFSIAKSSMDTIIRNDVQRSIGGDQQRITQLQTQHSDTTFKHILLPLWSASFQFRKKTYRFVVNGRSGQTRGERPYSVIKIVSTAIMAVVIIGAGIYALNYYGLLENF